MCIWTKAKRSVGLYDRPGQFNSDTESDVGWIPKGRHTVSMPVRPSEYG